MYIKYERIGKETVRLVPSMEGLLTLERYLEIARVLLENGLSDDGRLNDETSRDLTDNYLLRDELVEKVTGVTFSIKGQEFYVNLGNIDNILSEVRQGNKQYKDTSSTPEANKIAQEVLTELHESTFLR